MKTLPVLQLNAEDGSPAECSDALVDPVAGWRQPGGGVPSSGQLSGAG